jgi:hypothetical protein
MPLLHKQLDLEAGVGIERVFTDCQPQYPDLQGYFTVDFTRVQALFHTICQLSDLTRQLPGFYPVIEEIVEGFVEGFLTKLAASADASSA